MQYCSLVYLAAFLPITLLIYALTNKKKRWLVLLIASYIFFLSLSGKLIVYLLFSTLSIHHFGLWLDRLNKDRDKEVELNKENKKEIKELYAYFDFPVLPEELKAEDIVKETRHDKKMEHGKIKFILLDKVGEATIYQDVTPEEMLTVLERV